MESTLKDGILKNGTLVKGVIVLSWKLKGIPPSLIEHSTLSKMLQ